MKVKDVLSDVAVRLGKSELTTYWNGSIVDDREADSKELIACYNETEKDIALQFFPLTAEQEFIVTDDKISYSRFARQPSAIKRICGEGGVSLEYDLYASYLSVKAENVKILYRYLPTDKGIDGTCEVAFGVPYAALVAGVMKNYYLTRGMLAESSVWNAEYFSCLQAAVRENRKEKKWRERRWV